MKLKSTRLPEVEVENGENYSFEIDEKDILTAVTPSSPFEDKEYALVTTTYSPFLCLHSVENPEVSFFGFRAVFL